MAEQEYEFEVTIGFKGTRDAIYEAFSYTINGDCFTPGVVKGVDSVYIARVKEVS